MTKIPKERVDVLLVEQGLFETREKAKRAIMAGLIYKNEERIDKPGEKVENTSVLTVKGQVLKYVSRGGLKLEKALEQFNLSIEDRIMLDIGSSTGGFTDCGLQNGVKHAYALDVGSNQLAWKIRQDARVTVMEKTNFRYSTPADFLEGLPSFASIDVSFISLKLIFPTLKTILVPNGDVIALVKPQFEAGKDRVGKKGVIRDKAVHVDVLNDIANFAESQRFRLKNASFSPITGGEGNIEFLFHLTNIVGEEFPPHQIDFAKLVGEAHQLLK
ncbi:23S rRNA (cytidine1920-2'-O)/16S rRNA (cytidine1409-2'-O)-methyltransferase [Paenisporosarcina quisquiliarum]|nr:23S rRNA (cytidine1920-2'-O)/16S rRNA (cytidine1409-2'-O)-methyltransferase [Paenisporosarcina quisquiliarum]